MENATVTIGEDVSLSCEVRSYPGTLSPRSLLAYLSGIISKSCSPLASVLHWEFVAEGSSSPIPLVLPGTHK